MQLARSLFTGGQWQAVALLRPSLRLHSTNPAPALEPSVAFDPLSPGVPTTDDCIPLSPPYTLSSLLTPAAPLPEPTLRKLHQLASLPYPSSVTAESLQDLIGVVDGIRSERVRLLLEQAAKEDDGLARDDLSWGRKEIVFDGANELALAEELERGDGTKIAHGRELLKDAKKILGGAYYAVKNPKT